MEKFENLQNESHAETSAERLEGFELLISRFESKYDFAHLMNITEGDEAENDPSRLEAKDDLIPIVKIIEIFRNDQNILDDHWERAISQYERCSQAVGIINRNKETGIRIVDHSRKASRERFRHWAQF